MLKINLLFKKFTNVMEITQEPSGLRLQNFQVIDFV